MSVNKDKSRLWKRDIAASVDLYNDWFIRFAPAAFRTERVKTTAAVKDMFQLTASLKTLTPAVLRMHPSVLPALRMSTCPPIARDRLVGLAGVGKSLVGSMEDGRIPPRMDSAALERDLRRICEKITALLDRDMLPWLTDRSRPDAATLDRSATIVADRLCGAQADPIIRNAQEARQLAAIARWLMRRGYRRIAPHPADQHPKTMPAGTFAFRMNVRVGPNLGLSIPVDVVVQPKKPRKDRMPILIEAKSAGDFTNVNKRRKEESDKMGRLKKRFGAATPYVLFLCGYFDGGYLGYEAAEGIDWVWEHRIGDLARLGL
ncbi:MAG: XamI family restriction endonuclease [bacterium]